MVKSINNQNPAYLVFYVIFGIVSASLIVYYLSDTIIHITTPQQFPINSFERFPLTFLIFPAEIFSFLFSLYFVYNLVNGNQALEDPKPLTSRQKRKVAVLIPVYNEPAEVVSRTLAACQNIRWPGTTSIYLLDDSTVDEDKKNMRSLAKKFGCTLVTRNERDGYKAGNINHAVKTAVREEFFAVFDSDQAPEPEFLEETMDYFSDTDVAFVQTPQNFINSGTPLERAAQLGTNIFYHSQCVSKSKDKAMPFCGTNAVVRSASFRSVNGFSYYTSTEDIELGLRLNEAGYHGIYVPKVLVHGYAPTSFSSYSSQQYRWSNGNLAILRESWVRILFGKLSFRQQLHAFFTLGWWLVGLVTIIYITVPILSFFSNGTHHTWLPTSLLALLFLNVLMGFFMIFASMHRRLENEKISFPDALLQYSLITNSMFIYSKATISALLGKYAGFVRTDKRMVESSIWQVKWNLLLAAACFCFSIYALYHASIASDFQQVRTYLPVSIWLLFYSMVLGSSVMFVGSPAGNQLAYPEAGLAVSTLGRKELTSKERLAYGQ